MKVLFISGADQQYGTFHISMNLLECMRVINKDIQLVVITQKYGPLNEWCVINHFENYVIPYRYCVYYPTNKKIKRLIKHCLKYVIVTVSNWIAMQKLNRMGILNNVDIIHTNINRDLFGNLIARKYNIPHITHLREFSRSHFHLEPIYKNQIAMMNNYTDCFIAISNAVKNDWIDYGINKSKITVIYDGINTKEYQSCHKIIQVKMGLKIVMSGAIYEGKGQYELLLAVGPLIKLGYDISVDYFGSSTNKGYYRQLLTYIEDNGLKKKIHFKGFIENLLDVLSEYDVGVICSKSEGFGLVTIEYMLSGITVIASDTGANPELLCNGEYGYLYPLGNVNELRRIIKELYDNEINRNSKENNTINYVKEKFSIEKTANDVMKLYSDILDKV